jgi:hypothetical protein
MKNPSPFILLFLLPIAALAQASADLTAAIRTPPAPATPRINGPRVYGERPGNPFLYHLPVTGTRPITITAQGLPSGLTLDATSGNITGVVTQPGDNPVTFTAVNSSGTDTATIHFIIGPNICLTPQLGWNSWNCFHGDIDEAKIRGAADAMVATGLIDHGWTYINMDDRWEGQRDAAGNIQSSEKIPDMKALANYIHGLGLKIGLYSSPGPVTCANALGSFKHEDQDAATYASWDIDYLKYDWCSYGSIAVMDRDYQYAHFLPATDAAEIKSLADEDAVLSMERYHRDASLLPQTDSIKAFVTKAATMTRDQMATRIKEIETRLGQLHDEAAKLNPDRLPGEIDLQLDKQPYQQMRASLDKVKRDILYSFCQYGMGKVWEWGAETGGNSWRTTGDIQDNWKSIADHGFNQNGLEKYAGPGHWNDPDMLEIGNGKLTPDENYTHMTLWVMLTSPLLIGCDMPRMSPFIVSLFSNDEVLAVNQDPLGKQGWRAKQDGQHEVWMKPLADGSLAVAFFNRADAPADVSVQWADLKLTGPQSLRDLWRQKDIAPQDTGYKVNVAPHGAELFKVTPKN